MSIKGSAQQMADTSLDLVQAIITLAKNPATIDKMKHDLIEASTISDERKKEADTALKTIAEAKQLLAELEEKRKTHAAYVDSMTVKFRENENALNTAAAKLAEDTKKSKADYAARITDIDAQRKEIDQNRKAAEARHKNAADRESAIHIQIADIAQREQTLIRNQKAYEDAVLKLNARKKKIAAAVSASEEE